MAPQLSNVQDATQGQPEPDVEVTMKVIGVDTAAPWDAYRSDVEKASSAMPIGTSNVIQPEASERLYTMAGAIEPPYSLDALNNLFEHSNALRQNIDAYVTNIDSFGHRFVPVIDFDAADADQRIADAIYDRRLRDLANPQTPPPTGSLRPTPEEVQEEKRHLTEEMRREKRRLERFFDFCGEQESWVTMRRWVRQDLELLGNAYLEVLRNGAGEIAQFTYVAGYTVRITQVSLESTPVTTSRKISEFDYEDVTVERKLRRFVQVVEGRIAFFKEMGDPRVMSRNNGEIFPSVAALLEHDPNDAPATELMHFKIHSGRSVYGIPRWMGSLLSVLGSRQAEEVNSLYFDNKGVPPLAVLVSGGRLAPSTVARLEAHITNEIKGRRNFHKILILEAESQAGAIDASSGGSTRIDMKPLNAAQHDDGLFMKYDERNIDKVGMTFRLPRILRGDVNDVNRSSAEAALTFAEEQVFGPERSTFDFTVNRRILSDLRIRFWTFKSNGPALRDPKELADIIATLVEKGVLTPGEARDFCEGVFDKPLREINESWTEQPISLTLAGLTTEDPTEEPWTGDDVPPGAARSAYGDLDGDGTDDTGKASNAATPKLTPTMMGIVVTVNEARAAHGLAPLALPDGTPDPAGNMTLAAYRAKQESAAEQGQPRRPAMKRPKGARGTFTMADRLRGDGIASGPPAQRPQSAVSQAESLIRLRDQLLEADRIAAKRDFLLAKAREIREAGGFPPERIAQAMPMPPPPPDVAGYYSDDNKG